MFLEASFLFWGGGGGGGLLILKDLIISFQINMIIPQFQSKNENQHPLNKISQDTTTSNFPIHTRLIKK
jgi:hypothetical protein